MPDEPPLPRSTAEALSSRERQVLDLAVVGRTDEQIAQALGLSLYTVNCYWVRVRGKVGHLSRVEIVALVLQGRFQEERAALVDEIARLEEEQRRQDAEIARLQTEILRMRPKSGEPLEHDENHPRSS